MTTQIDNIDAYMEAQKSKIINDMLEDIKKAISQKAKSGDFREEIRNEKTIKVITCLLKDLPNYKEMFPLENSSGAIYQSPSSSLQSYYKNMYETLVSLGLREGIKISKSINCGYNAEVRL